MNFHIVYSLHMQILHNLRKLYVMNYSKHIFGDMILFLWVKFFRIMRECAFVLVRDARIGASAERNYYRAGVPRNWEDLDNSKSIGVGRGLVFLLQWVQMRDRYSHYVLVMPISIPTVT